MPCPSRLVLARVVGFAVVDLSFENRRNIGLPSFVGRNPLHRSIRMLDAKLRFQCRRSVSVVVSLAEPHQRRGVPARRKVRPDRVRPVFTSAVTSYTW